jgi:hypothetical protein
MGNLLTPLRHRRRTVRQFSGSNDTEAAVLECVGLTASRYRALILDNNRADLTALDAHARKTESDGHALADLVQSPEIWRGLLTDAGPCNAEHQTEGASAPHGTSNMQGE